MLLPRFTIRTLLVICTLCAVVFVIAGAAVRGHYWAWGVTIGIGSLVITALVHSAWFGAVWSLARMLSPRTDAAQLAAAVASIQRIDRQPPAATDDRQPTQPPAAP
jgi:hypothetical protein